MRLEDAYLEFSYAKDHSPASRQWYHSRLTAFFNWCHEQQVDGHRVTEMEQLSAPLIRRYIEARRSAGTLSSHTLHGHVRAIKALLNWSGQEGLLSEQVARRIKLPVREQILIPTFSKEQIDWLFRACRMTPVGTENFVARDHAIIAVLVDTGIRANELCTLTLDHVTLDQDDAYLRVYGKGRKEREVGLGRHARNALARYIHRDRPRCDSPYVFLARGGVGGVHGKQPLTPGGLDQMLYRLRDRVGAERFTGVRVSAHTFRHTFAVHYLANGGDVYKLARLLGHTSVAVTEGYLKSFKAKDARQGMSVLDGFTVRDGRSTAGRGETKHNK